MGKRTAVRLVSFCMAAVLIGVGFVIRAERRVGRYRLEIQNGYSKSMDDLNASVNNISLLLQKAAYTMTAAQIGSMAAELLGEAEMAKSALAQLPVGDRELTVLNRFLSQVGQYAMAVSKKLLNGNTMSDTDSGQLMLLGDTAQKVAQVLNESQILYNNLDYWAAELDRELDSTVPEESLTSVFGELEGDLADYPTLVYDGPFSDHILEKEPEMLRNASRITEEQALKIAENAAAGSKGSLRPDGTVAGKIPVYRFSSNTCTVAVSQLGGYVVYMRKSRVAGNTSLSAEAAVERAKRYLANQEMQNFTETYYDTDEGVCVVNFAYLDGETICYTDLVKVGVAMDTGEIMLYEASGFLANHTERAFETPAVSDEEAARVISPRLTVQETALALIPTDAAGEVRCYEFLCQAENGREILVYINAVTLAEERILILLKSDGGTLTK